MSILPGAIIAIVIVILLSIIAARLLVRFIRRRAAPSGRRVSAVETALLTTSVLPVFTFSAIEHPDRTECTICLSPFEPDDQLRLLPLCLHAFHVSCIDTWIRSHPTCPLCRLRIVASDSDVTTLLADSVEVVDEESPEIQQLTGHGTSDELPEEVQVTVEAPVPSEASLAADVASGRSRAWLGEFLDRISSSRSSSFRSSGRFTGSSRRESMGAAFAEYFRCISEF